MDIKISRQISATYARNHFKEVMDKAVKEGICMIVKKSKPITVILSMAEFEKLKSKAEDIKPKVKINKKITLEELEKNGIFSKYAGCLKDLYPGKTSVELAHEWYKYVD